MLLRSVLWLWRSHTSSPPFPLASAAQARAIFERLQRRYNVEFDASGAIGRRYRRMDEVGTPFCITVDFDTLEDDTVTLRDRDTTEQRRVSVPELLEYLEEQIEG